MEEHSLDEFLDAEGASAASASDDGEASTPGNPESPPSGEAGQGKEDPEPATLDESESITENQQPEPPTARFTGDGQDCAVCSEQTTRLWYDGGRAVCPSCKSW